MDFGSHKLHLLHNLRGTYGDRVLNVLSVSTAVKLIIDALERRSTDRPHHHPFIVYAYLSSKMKHTDIDVFVR